jgi:hypothetical protein
MNMDWIKNALILVIPNMVESRINVIVRLSILMGLWISEDVFCFSQEEYFLK